MAYVLSLSTTRSQESTPIIIGDTLYVSSSWGPKFVYAAEAKTGKVKWRYLEYADLIGQELKRPIEHVWVVTIYGERAIRASLLSDRCDIMLGLPQDGNMGPKLIIIIARTAMARMR